MPRGFNGVMARITGPGASRAEIAFQIVLPMLATSATLYYAIYNSQTVLQIVLAGLLGFDIAGGIVTNSTSSAKRWYHRSGQGFWQHMGFISLHLVHLSIVVFTFGTGYFWLLMHGLVLILSSTAILLSAIYLQRTISLSVYSLALIISMMFGSVPGLEWFLPLFYLKLLVAHLPVEEPYRPIEEEKKQ